MDRRIDWLPAFAFAIFGALFFYESFQIVSFGQGSGGTIVPRAASGLVMILAVIQLALVVLGRSHGAADHIDLREFAAHSGPIIFLMVLYGYCHGWFGYFIATFICALIAFKLFENSWRASLIHAAAGTIVLYVVFIKVLGVYDPAGRLINISGWI